MAFGRAAAEYDVGFNVRTGEFKADMAEVLGVYSRTTGAMSNEALRAAVAQEKLDRAIKQHGPSSLQARRATLDYRREVESLGRSSVRTGSELRGAERDLGRFTRGALVGSGALTHLGRAAAFASTTFLGGAGLVYAIKKSLQDASDLNEQINKTNQVFGTSARTVVRWSRDSATALAQTRAEALGTASSIGSLLRPVGILPEKAAEISTTLTKLGADLASFYNTDVDAALKAIQSGLVGQVRPLRQYGVQLDAARVNELALVQTHKEHVSELTSAEKTLARYTIILRDTKIAQGDLARTSGGLANQERILTANIGDLSEMAGKTLYPEVNRVIHGLNDWLGKSKNQQKVQRDLSKAVKDGTEIVHGLVEAERLIAPPIKTAISALGGLEHAVEAALVIGAILKVRKFADSFGLITAASARARTAIVADAAIEQGALSRVIAAEALAGSTPFGGGGGGGGGRGGGGIGLTAAAIAAAAAAKAKTILTPTGITGFGSAAITGLSLYPDSISPPTPNARFIFGDHQAGEIFTAGGVTYRVVATDHSHGGAWAVPYTPPPEKARPNLFDRRPPAISAPNFFGNPSAYTSFPGIAPNSGPLTPAQQRAVDLARNPDSLSALTAQTTYDRNALAFLEKRYRAGKISAAAYVKQYQAIAADLQSNQDHIDQINQQAADKRASSARKARTAAQRRLKERLAVESQPLVDAAAAAFAQFRTGRRRPEFVAGNPQGLLRRGNIDIANRPIAYNADGSISTVRSITISEDGKAILLPTVVGGKVVSDEQAIEHYRRTGKNLGVFSSEAAANRYSEALHDQQAQLYLGRPQMPPEVARLIAFYKREAHDANLSGSEHARYAHLANQEEQKWATVVHRLDEERTKAVRKAHEQHAKEVQRRRAIREQILQNNLAEAQLQETQAGTNASALNRARAAEIKAELAILAYQRQELKGLSGLAKAQKQGDIIATQDAIAALRNQQKVKSDTGADIRQFLSSFADITQNYAPNALPGGAKAVTHLYELVHESRKSNKHLREIVAADAFPASRYAHASAAGASS